MAKNIFRISQITTVVVIVTGLLTISQSKARGFIQPLGTPPISPPLRSPLPLLYHRTETGAGGVRSVREKGGGRLGELGVQQQQKYDVDEYLKSIDRWYGRNKRTRRSFDSKEIQKRGIGGTPSAWAWLMNYNSLVTKETREFQDDNEVLNKQALQNSQSDALFVLNLARLTASKLKLSSSSSSVSSALSWLERTSSKASPLVIDVRGGKLDSTKENMSQSLKTADDPFFVRFRHHLTSTTRATAGAIKKMLQYPKQMIKVTQSHLGKISCIGSWAKNTLVSVGSIMTSLLLGGSGRGGKADRFTLFHTFKATTANIITVAVMITHPFRAFLLWEFLHIQGYYE